MARKHASPASWHIVLNAFALVTDQSLVNCCSDQTTRRVFGFHAMTCCQKLCARIIFLAATFVGGSISAQPSTTADQVYSTEVNGRTFDLFIPKGISTIRGILFYGPGVNADSRSALGDIGCITKSHLLGYPILAYNKGSRVVPRDANTAISITP